MIHDVVRRPADEELDRPRPRRLPLGVVGADGVEVVSPVPRETFGRQDVGEFRPHLDLTGELSGFTAVGVADDLLAASSATT